MMSVTESHGIIRVMLQHHYSNTKWLAHFGHAECLRLNSKFSVHEQYFSDVITFCLTAMKTIRVTIVLLSMASVL